MWLEYKQNTGGWGKNAVWANRKNAEKCGKIRKNAEK
jgi:hypothetical protein